MDWPWIRDEGSDLTKRIGTLETKTRGVVYQSSIPCRVKTVVFTHIEAPKPEQVARGPCSSERVGQYFDKNSRGLKR